MKLILKYKRNVSWNFWHNRFRSEENIAEDIFEIFFNLIGVKKKEVTINDLANFRE